MDAWLAVWHRLAAEPSTPPQADQDADPPVGSSGPAVPPPARAVRVRSWRIPAAALAVVAAVSVAAVAGVWISDGRQRRSDYPAISAGGSAPAKVGGQSVALPAGWARIHPVRTPDLCVTEGVDRTGRYGSAVAAQRPCAEAEPPKTILEPVRDDLYFIKWDHPAQGVGCLTVIVDGVGRDLLEPRNDCQAGRPSQLFRVEPAGTTTPVRYRLRPTHADLCLGIKDDDRAAGAEVVEEPCTGAADQEFLIELPSANTQS
ncbi:RICIN domain-containing protein [Dactylosporangium sp. CA-233914]|uniref:RICIN domain-containing protein n=1 Tax=Dactylosporangium sp. CA-233914 TaxID=3239934 RepID=UPI003D8C867B